MDFDISVRDGKNRVLKIVRSVDKHFVVDEISDSEEHLTAHFSVATFVREVSTAYVIVLRVEADASENSGCKYENVIVDPFGNFDFVVFVGVFIDE
jgi:hypothetical protein